MLGAAACAGDGAGLDPCGNPVGTVPCGSDDSVRLSTSVQPIFDQNCAFSGCHAAPQPAQGMNLSRGQSFASIVDVPSVELPSMRRVRPFQPDSSYLVHKLEGTHLQVGGQGERMPLGRAHPLTPQQIALIRSWISQGARNN